MTKSIHKQISARQLISDYEIELADTRKEAESIFCFLTYINRSATTLSASEIISLVRVHGLELLKQFKFIRPNGNNIYAI